MLKEGTKTTKKSHLNEAWNVAENAAYQQKVSRKGFRRQTAGTLEMDPKEWVPQRDSDTTSCLRPVAKEGVRLFSEKG